jgi:hypothetical protein
MGIPNKHIWVKHGAWVAVGTPVTRCPSPHTIKRKKEFLTHPQINTKNHEEELKIRTEGAND